MAGTIEFCQTFETGSRSEWLTRKQQLTPILYIFNCILLMENATSQKYDTIYAQVKALFKAKLNMVKLLENVYT